MIYDDDYGDYDDDDDNDFFITICYLFIITYKFIITIYSYVILVIIY